MNYKEMAIERFSSDNYAVSTTGIKIEEVDENYAKCSLKIDSRHFNSSGNVMGGAIFTLVDYAFGVAANTTNPQTVTLSGSINYVRPTTGPMLYAEAKCIKSGRCISFFEVSVTDEEGNVIATALTNGFQKQ